VSIRARHLAAAAAFALAAHAAGNAAAAAQMFKCVEGGRTVYQQQACSVSSQPDPAASAPHAASKASAAASKASAAADPASAGARKVKRPSPTASSAPATPR